MVLPIQLIPLPVGLNAHDAWCINVVSNLAVLGTFGVIYGAILDTAFKALAWKLRKQSKL